MTSDTRGTLLKLFGCQLRGLEFKSHSAEFGRIRTIFADPGYHVVSTDWPHVVAMCLPTQTATSTHNQRPTTNRTNTSTSQSASIYLPRHHMFSLSSYSLTHVTMELVPDQLSIHTYMPHVIMRCCHIIQLYSLNSTWHFVGMPRGTPARFLHVCTKIQNVITYLYEVRLIKFKCHWKSLNELFVMDPFSSESKMINFVWLQRFSQITQAL